MRHFKSGKYANKDYVLWYVVQTQKSHHTNIQITGVALDGNIDVLL